METQKSVVSVRPGTEAATARLGEAAGARAMAPCVGTGARFQYRLRKRVIACSGSTVGTASSASRDERCMPSVGRTTRVRIGGRGLTVSASPGASPPVTLPCAQSGLPRCRCEPGARAVASPIRSRARPRRHETPHRHHWVLFHPLQLLALVCGCRKHSCCVVALPAQPRLRRAARCGPWTAKFLAPCECSASGVRSVPGSVHRRAAVDRSRGPVPARAHRPRASGTRCALAGTAPT